MSTSSTVRTALGADSPVSATDVEPTTSLREQARSRDWTRDAAATLGLIVAGYALSWGLRLPMATSSLLVYGVPLGYLLTVSPDVRRRLWPKFLTLLIVFAVVFFDGLAARFGAWRSPTKFPFRLPYDAAVEEVEWTILFFLVTIVAHERFLARPTPERIRPAARLILKSMFYVGLAVALLLPIFANPTGHVYLALGLATQIPVIILALWVNPRLVPELVAIAVLSGGLNLAYEVLALRLDYWVFPGAYTGWVTVLGYRFPLEEFQFMVVFAGASLVATYSIYKNWKQIR